MKEQLITFETAKLAKEKGWKYPTLNFYFEDGESKENVLREETGMDYGSEFTIEFSELIENWNDKWLTKKDGSRCFGCSKTKGYLETFSAPTQSLLQKWIREEHILYVIVDWTGTSWSYKFNGTVKGNDNTYEEALEKGLYEALKLIKLRDEKKIRI